MRSANDSMEAGRRLKDRKGSCGNTWATAYISKKEDKKNGLALREPG